MHQSLLRNISKLQATANSESRRELISCKMEIYKELSGYLSRVNSNTSIDDKSITYLFDSYFSKYNDGDDLSLHISESNQNFFKELFMYFLKREPQHSFDESGDEDVDTSRKRIKKLNFQ